MRVRRRAVLAVVAVAALLAACSGGDDAADGPGTSTTATTQTETTTADDPYDGHASEVYDDEAHWICRPDLADDECRDLDVTVVGPDGSVTVEEREPAADPPIDCFYVYPTVSADPPPLADLEWTPADNEALTVMAQAAQYARACRVFAPVYRQIPLAGLGSASPEARAEAYAGVVDAWKTYVSRWNEGRGVVLIGHSQGTGHLVRLIADEIDAVPEVRERLVAAHLFGGKVAVPDGELVGGSFQNVPGCTTADEAGCVVSFSSYPATAAPGEDGIFGRADEEGRALCTDPTALLGEERSHPVAPVAAPLIGSVEGTEDLTTPFVALPEALALSCETTADHDYLAVGVADPEDPRPAGGFVNETLGHTWGLHLVDVNVALDDLVALAERQGRAHQG